MSQFYDQASLVVVPSGYKAGTVYAQKPLTTDGQLAFTRTGDTATRVNSAGLIEKVRTNLILQSQTFDNASWTKDGATVTANATTAPDGTTTADKVIETATTAIHNVYQTPTLSSNIYSFSVFVKKAERFKCALADRNSGAYVAFNINTGVIIESLVFSGKIESYSNDWYRLTITTPSAYSVFQPQVFILPDSYTTGVPALITYAGSATSGLFVWGAQLETSDFGATPYIPTLTAAVSTGPTANVPRLDYLGSTCPRLLLEPQRTNLYTYSEQLNQWTASSATVTANYAVSPDGYTNADRVQFASGGGLYVNGTGSAGQNTLSVYAKATNGVSAKFRFFANGATLFSSDQTATGEWQRFTFTYTYSAVTAGLAAATTGADDIIFWGFQHEIGAYATSLIPTLAATATRGADACSKTGISSLIGQTEGTLFAEFVVDSSTSPNMPFFVSAAGLFDNAIWIQQSASDSVIFRVFSGTTAQCSITKTGLTNGQTVKVAGAYKANDFVLYVNGVQVGTDNSGSIPSSLSQLEIGSYSEVGAPFNQNRPVKQALLFKTRLTNAQLAELTTL